jgi:hypothetical protein
MQRALTALGVRWFLVDWVDWQMGMGAIRNCDLGRDLSENKNSCPTSIQLRLGPPYGI